MRTRRKGRWLLKQPRLGARMCQGTFFFNFNLKQLKLLTGDERKRKFMKLRKILGLSAAVVLLCLTGCADKTVSGEHEAVTKEIRKILQTKFEQTLALSADSCEICGTCAYPNAPCRHPDHMVPCIEGYGVVVADFARKAGIEFMNGAGIVTWFGMVLVK